MATIITKKKKGRVYYYAVQSGRVNGKPRIVWQKYLGTVDAIIQRADEAKPPKPKETVIFQAGGIAALLGIAHRLRFLEIVNDVVPKREQGASVGHYMLLAALNRALAPCSKVTIGDWYEETVLRRLWRFPKTAFSSQRFWDHMDMISQEAIDTIQQRIAPQIHREFGLDPRVLLYDTTNFFTFLATSNDRCTIGQRGNSKAKRHDLRQIGLALLVARPFQIPLFHRVYPGNVPDVSLFPGLSQDLLKRYKQAFGPAEQACLVFDKGNISDDAMDQLVVSNSHFVAALPMNQDEHNLLRRPLDEFEDLPALPGTRAFTTEVDMWGKRLRAVVAYTESFFTQQLAGVTHNLVKCQKKLLDLEKSLRKWHQGKARGKKPTVRGVQQSVKRILSAQFMKQLFRISVEHERSLPRLIYSVDHGALEKLTNERLGRTLLVTDHREWSALETIEAYRSLTEIEDVFRDMKNVDFLRWQPAHHWTDQKLRVHAFYCVQGLLLASLARKESVRKGIELPLLAMLAELSKIREVAVIYPKGSLAHRKDHITLSRMSPRQRKLAEGLGIAEVLDG
ncbi:IS1634 family transposase [Acidobacteriota bacterium]